MESSFLGTDPHVAKIIMEARENFTQEQHESVMVSSFCMVNELILKCVEVFLIC